MRPVSEAFLRSVKASHPMVARARVCPTYQTGTNPPGTFIPILGGDVRLDANAQIRSTLDITTDGHKMWPETAGALLAPYGNEIYVERGIQYSDGLAEYVGLGYHRIQTPEQDDPPDGPIRLECRDRMAGIVDARLLEPVQFLAGSTLGGIVATLVREVYPLAVIEWDDNSDTAMITRPVIAEDDRYEFLDRLIAARSKIWYWDHRGVLVIKSVPDPLTPVFEVHAGTGGVLVSVNRRLTREGVYNAVVALGEATDTAAPVRGVAIDNKATSPTYFYGRFGPVPRFFTSSFLTTDIQAFNAAEAILRRQLGLPYAIDFRAVANPALEPWDAVSVRAARSEGRRTHVLQTVTIPLVPKTPMSAATREQSVVLVGSL